MTTIEILRPTDWQVIIYGDNFGRVYLETEAGLSIAMTKALDALSQFQQVTQEAALSISLPATERNKALLEAYRPDVLRRPVNPIAVEVLSEGERVPVSAMMVTGFDSDFDVELFADDWIDQLERLQLRSLELGSFPSWDESGVLDAWNGDRQQLAVPLLAHYGGWYSPPGVVLEDLRFVFNHWLLLKACFCAIGWQLESDHLRVGNGAFAYSYLSGDRWYSYRGKEDVRFVRVNIDPERAMTGIDENILFDVVSDPLSLYNTTRPYDWFFGIADPGPFDVQIEVRNLVVLLPPPPPGDGAYSFFVQAYKNDNGTLVLLDFVTAVGATDRTATRTLNFDILDRNATGGDSYGFFFGYGDLSSSLRVPYTLRSCEVAFRPDFPYYERGQEVYFADLFAPELSAMQLFTAVAELCNGKVTTDYGSRTVRLEAAYDYPSDGEVIKGFFLRSLPPIDVRELTEPGSLAWKRLDTERDRFLNLAFADAKDAYVLQQQRQDVYNYILDRERGKDSTKDFENSLFEPTIELFVSPDDVGSNGVYLPALWDNTVGDRSNNLGARVFIFYPATAQFDAEGTRLSFLFEGVEIKDIPYFAQVAGRPVATEMVPLSFTGFANDLYQLHYRRELVNEDDGTEYSVFLVGSDATYFLIDFRRTLLIQGDDAGIEVQPVAVKDHEFGSRVPLLVMAKIKSC